MNRQLIFGSLAALGLLAATSCSSEEDMPTNPGDGATFTVRIPGHISTRGTFGDGTDAGDRATLDNLQWTVFEVSGDDANPTLTKVFSDAKSGAFGASQTEETVTINLAKGKKYQVAFYADDKDNNFVTYADGDITVNYNNGASNTAAEDAFIGKSDVFTVGGAFNKTVTLTRPFAQLNWGTDDTTEKSIEPLMGNLTGTVTVSQGLYSKMNVISGEVDAASTVNTPVTFAAVNFSALPGNTFPVAKEDADAKPYLLIAMNYLLTGNGTIDCELAFNNGLSPVTVSAAPVKVNYRTNIYGSLLTAPGQFNIKIDNNFIDNLDYEVVPRTADEFVAALTNPLVKTINVTENLNLTDYTTEQLTFSTPKTINVAEGKTLQLGDKNTIVANNGLTLEGKGKITNFTGSTGSGYDDILEISNGNIVRSEAKKLIEVMGGDLVIKGVTLENDPNWFWHDVPAKTNCATISYYNDVNVTIENATITSGGFALCAMFTCTGDVKIKNSVIKSTSSNINKHYAYAMRLRGNNVILDDVTVDGIQGGISFEHPNTNAVINSGKYSTHNTPGKQDAWHPIYITSGAKVTIKGGEFYAPNTWHFTADKIGGTSCVVVSDNDTGQPLGHIINITGGKFSGKAYNAKTGEVYGFPYTELTDGGDYRWTIQ